MLLILTGLLALNIIPLSFYIMPALLPVADADADNRAKRRINRFMAGIALLNVVAYLLLYTHHTSPTP